MNIYRQGWSLPQTYHACEIPDGTVLGPKTIYPTEALCGETKFRGLALSISDLVVYGFSVCAKCVQAGSQTPAEAQAAAAAATIAASPTAASTAASASASTTAKT
jgi:hypothetical protein